jgi:hypothetical protein
MGIHGGLLKPQAVVLHELSQHMLLFDTFIHALWHSSDVVRRRDKKTNWWGVP